MLYKPLCSSSFTNLDTFVDFIVSSFDMILERSTNIILEPDKIPCHLGEMYNPEKIGIPYTAMLRTIFDSDLIINALAPQCIPQRGQGGIYRRTLRVVADRRMTALMQRFYNLTNVNVVDLRDRFLAMWSYILGGSIPAKVPPVVNELKRIHPMVDPFFMNDAFRHLPLALQFTYGMVCEIFFPEFNIVPLAAKEVNDATGSSTTRNTVVMGFNAIGLSSTANDAIYGYLSTFLVPGFVEMNVVFDGIEKTSPVYLLSLLC